MKLRSRDHCIKIYVILLDIPFVSIFKIYSKAIHSLIKCDNEKVEKKISK